MQKSKKKIEPLPDEFKTLKEASDFWDTHDISDYWDKTREATFKARLKKEPKYVALEDSIAKKVSTLAKKKHVSTETLINLWLKEKLAAAR
ncbi:MAG TPA: CopG family antitoxin [Nitrospirota bacterium]|nr:CopG family antitoxin [Nitrospirota bacterium]